MRSILKRATYPFNGIGESTYGLAAMQTSELEMLRIAAMESLSNLGYFNSDAKELQCFNVEIRNNVDRLANPGAIDKFTFQVTTVQHPAPAFIITRNYHIKGKRFNAGKCLQPFTACGYNGVVFGQRGKCLYPDQFKAVLNKLINWNTPPAKRPVK